MEESIIEVEQGNCETILEGDVNTIIKTGGVGPCVAIIVYGTAFYAEKDEDEDEDENEDENENEEEEEEEKKKDKKEEQELIEKRFISLYHLQDEYYRLCCLSLKELPSIEKLKENYISYIPLLISCNQEMWVYGFDSNEKPKLTQVANNSAYTLLQFAESPKDLKANLIDDDIYIAIGKQKAHCEYFARTNNGPVEAEENFNYCVTKMKEQLVDELFSSINRANKNLELKKIKVVQVELVGGQLADEQIMGSEMQARALERNFRNPDPLADSISDDLEIIIDFSDMIISTDKLLTANNNESYFDVEACFTHTGMKVESNLILVKEEIIPNAAEITRTANNPLFKTEENKKRKFENISEDTSKKKKTEEETKKLNQ